MKFNRRWAMPSKSTFTIKPIQELLMKYDVGKGWIDPFAGWNSTAEFTNDINIESPAEFHLEASDFVNQYIGRREFDGALFDPPYSPRQITENYRAVGVSVTSLMTSSNFYRLVKRPLAAVIKPGGYCISFGWNSNGMGKGLGFEIIEIMLVAHGAGHNDTICIVEKKEAEDEDD